MEGLCWKFEVSRGRKPQASPTSARNKEGSVLPFLYLPRGPKACRFPAETPQIIELGTAHPSAADHLHAVNDGRVEREDALDALAEGDFPYRKAGSRTRTATREDGSFKGLEAFLVSLFNFHPDADRITGFEFRQIGPQVLLLNFCHAAHGISNLPFT